MISLSESLSSPSALSYASQVRFFLNAQPVVSRPSAHPVPAPLVAASVPVPASSPTIAKPSVTASAPVSVSSHTITKPTTSFAASAASRSIFQESASQSVASVPKPTALPNSGAASPISSMTSSAKLKWLIISN